MTEINEMKTKRMTQRINETVLLKDKQDWQTLSQAHQMEKRETQIKKIRDEKADIATIVNERGSFFKNLYADKLENLEEMDKFLDAYEFSRLSQEEINHLRRSITSNEIEAIIKSFPAKKSPGLDGFIAELYETFKEEVAPILCKLFYKTEKEGILPNTLTILKLDKDTTKKEKNY
jgi:hypothetical protein